MELLQILERYAPFNEQEARDRAVLMGLLRTGQNLWTRENEAAHLTASAWVVNGDRERVLMAYHNIYDLVLAGRTCGRRAGSAGRGDAGGTGRERTGPGGAGVGGALFPGDPDGGRP